MNERTETAPWRSCRDEQCRTLGRCMSSPMPCSAETAARTRFVAFVTKYALTAGIEEIEVEDCFDISKDMVSAAVRSSDGWSKNYHKGEWHRTREEAVARAEQMREEKVNSLRSSLAKFERMTFA